MNKIPFNKPPYTGLEDQFVLEALHSNKISGDGSFSRQCQTWFEKNLPCKKALLTPSCTAALEMAALLIDIQPGDEVIMPSYTFVSTANAFALRGASIVFVDIRPDTMNINEQLIEEAITEKTKAIVPVHYAGVACEMQRIMEIAEEYNVYVIEDSAQGMRSLYKNQSLGTIGHIGAYSFHETKNFTSGGEGGLLIINDERFIQRSEILREKGTNRSQFITGQVDKYTWVDIGSSFLPSELQAAYLWAQLGQVEKITDNRLRSWNTYYTELQTLVKAGKIEMPSVPSECVHNAHMFYIKVANQDTRDNLISFLKSREIMSVFHYIPLHSSPAAKKYSRLNGNDTFTSMESSRLLRLPLFYGFSSNDIKAVIKGILEFFN